jgi:protein TonB
MTTYAPVPAFAAQGRQPRTLFLILAGHAAVIAAVMMAKGYVPVPRIDPPTVIDFIDPAKPPPENPPSPQRSERSTVDTPTTIVPIPAPDLPDVDTTPLPLPNPGPAIDPVPDTRATPTPPVRIGPRFLTREADVKPPYPPSKLRDGEEATLKLRLSIDERGRVIAVDPVGSADPVFLGAARKHLMARWRYQPATEDGRAVPTTTTITLRFELDG